MSNIEWILIIITIFLVILLFRYIQLKKQIRNLADQVNELNSGNSQQMLDISLIDKDLERLAGILNQYNIRQRQAVAGVLRNEEYLKESVANILTYEEVMNGHSKIRNKGIANIFSQMGLVEAWGSGIKRILNAAEEYGLPKPRFQEFDNMFRVELFRVNPITDQANQATNQANQDLERLDQVEDENVLSEKEIEILNLVRMQPSITQKEMANALDWNLASVKYYITKLKEKNYLKRQGSSQKGKWVILTKRD